MSITFAYGSSGSLDLPSEQVLAHIRGNPGVAVVAAEVRRAVSDTLDYPPLSQVAYPGDKVVLAVEPAVPQSEVVVATLIEQLVAGGVSASDISVLTREASNFQLSATSSEIPAEDVQLLVHDAQDRPQHALLGATERGAQVLLHRSLVEADVVLPVGCARHAASPGYLGPAGVAFPTFSSSQTKGRTSPNSQARQVEARRQAEEVARLLGSQFVVQVVPADEGGVFRILVGELSAVAREEQAVLEECWRSEVPSRAPLVIASVEGDESQQNWENVARAASAAAEVVENGGSVAVCCELATGPPLALRELAASGGSPSALRHLKQHHPQESLLAAGLQDVLSWCNLFLFSRVEAAALEDVGIAPVADVGELARLIRQHGACILVSSAQHIELHCGQTISQSNV